MPSFAAAAEEHLDDVYAYLVYLTGDRTMAEELTAETFARDPVYEEACAAASAR